MKPQTKPNIKVRTPAQVREKRYAFDKGQKHISAELICKYCSAIYEEKHWRPLSELKPEFIDKLKKVVCPACHAEKDLVSDGILHLTGTFLKKHREEISNLILRTEEKEYSRDVLNRIERIDETPDEITVYTAKNQLAVEIGKKVAEALKGGKLEIKWSKDDKPVEVRWHKDFDEKVKAVQKKKVINKRKK